VLSTQQEAASGLLSGGQGCGRVGKDNLDAGWRTAGQGCPVNRVRKIPENVGVGQLVGQLLLADDTMPEILIEPENESPLGALGLSVKHPVNRSLPLLPSLQSSPWPATRMSSPPRA
jgi:hypothetical protein